MSNATGSKQKLLEEHEGSGTLWVLQVERNLASGAKNLFMPHTLVAEQVCNVFATSPAAVSDNAAAGIIC